MAELTPYPIYKDSEVPWLEDIPAHWGLLRLGSLLRERGETNDQGKVTQVLSLLKDRGVIPYEQKGNIGNKRSEDITRYKVVHPNDIVLNSMNVIIGSVGLSQHRGCLSPVYYVLHRRSERDDPRYLNGIFQVKPFQQSLICLGKGILAHRMRIPMELLKCELLPRPPEYEQATIVRFLDYIDQRIQRYIRAKEKLIALLEEQKQVIIQRAVTRGLDPHVHLKPSGVEWLGEIPEHWVIVALRHRYSTELGKMLDAKRITGQYLVPYLRNVDVHWDHINNQDLAMMDIAPHEYVRYTLKTGDLLICEGGEVGRCAIWSGEFAPCGFQKALHRAAPLDVSQDLPRFLYYVMYTAAKLGVFVADGSENTFAHLTGVKLRRHRFAFPPKAEQESIVANLDKVVAASERFIAETSQEIGLIREYRTRLITDVVTGKLDVRQAAANLPDEAEELEDWDIGEAEEENDADLDEAGSEADDEG